jgi:hypothetical protein
MNAKKRKTTTLNDQELDTMLKKAQLPANPVGYWQKLPKRIVKQLCLDTTEKPKKRKAKSI